MRFYDCENFVYMIYLQKVLTRENVPIKLLAA